MSEKFYAAPELIAAIDAEVVPPSAVALWWIGQASFVVKAAGAIIYIDPYLAMSDRRVTPAAFAPSAVTNADIVLLTHDHGDHIDPSALPGIAAASPGARFVTPRPLVGRVGALIGGTDRIVPAVADEPFTLTVRGQQIEFIPVPAKHEEFFLTDEGYPYLGYTIRINGVTIHHTGDTIPFEGHAERVKAHVVDIAFLPINGRDFYRTRAGTIGNMDYREAAEFAVQIGADVAVPIHYGMFRGNTVPPGHFVSYLAEFHPEQAVHVMGRYGKYVYYRSR